MGIWALEFNPGLAGSIYKMVVFNGDVFGFVDSGAGAGVWRRTPPNWTATIGGGSRGAVWNDLMWWGLDPAGAAAREISRSPDGINWISDIDFGAGVYTSWSAIGGYQEYLYAAMSGFQGIAGTTFYRRDTSGNWVAFPPLYAEFNSSFDIQRWPSENRIYWSASAADVYRYHAVTGWEDEPTLDGEICYSFTIYAGSLFAGCGQNIYRRTAGGWTLEFSIGGAWGFGTLSEGDDGVLYVAAEDGVNSRVYARVGGVWLLHSTAAAVRFKSATAYNGQLYAGTHNCRFWVYAPDFNLAPGGLFPQEVDCDADGNALYVALYDAAAQPVLVKVALPLVPLAVGAAVFNPGAGSAINVKCSGVGGKLAVSGRFSVGGNDSVQVSDDGGVTWTDVAPAWADTAQPILVTPPDGIDALQTFLVAAQDAVETEDSGATWQTQNPALGFAPAAAAKLAQGDEVILAESPAGQVHYSPNRSHDLTGIGGPADVCALEVV